MKRVNKGIMSLLVLSVLAAGFSALFTGCGSSSAQDQMLYMHFFVVPASFPDGASTEEAVYRMKNYLLDLAGGYTELGKSQGGWISPSGEVEEEDNISFVVSASEEIRDELETFISENFDIEYPYVVAWEAL